MPSRTTRTAPTEVSTVRWTVSCACEATFSTCVRTSVTPRSMRRSAACAVASALRSARRSAVRALAVAALRARVVAAFLPAVERRVPAAFVVAAERLPVERLVERVPVERLPVERVPVERLDAERVLAERVVVRLRAAVERRAGAFLAAGLAALLPVLVLVVPVVSAMGSVLRGACKELSLKCYDVSVAIEHTFVTLDGGAVTRRFQSGPPRAAPPGTGGAATRARGAARRGHEPRRRRLAGGPEQRHRRAAQPGGGVVELGQRGQALGRRPRAVQRRHPALLDDRVDEPAADLVLAHLQLQAEQALDEAPCGRALAAAA